MAKSFLNYCTLQRFEYIRIFEVRWSNIRSIEYRTIEYRTLSEPFEYSMHRISNHRIGSLHRILRYSIDRTIRYRTYSMIEYFTVVRWFDIRRSNIELFEPSNIRWFGNPTGDRTRIKLANGDGRIS